MKCVHVIVMLTLLCICIFACRATGDDFDVHP